jgi:hypothetical protein
MRIAPVIILISPDTKYMERPDIICDITAAQTGVKSSTYQADCQTDAPSVDCMIVTVTPRMMARPSSNGEAAATAIATATSSARTPKKPRT